MKLFAVPAAVAALGALAACGDTTPKRPTAEQDVAAIMEFNKRYLGSINDEDIKTLAGLTTEGHVMIAPNRPPIVGKVANDAMNGRAFEQFEFDESWSPVETVVSGDLAFQRGTYVSTAKPRAGGESRSIRGSFLRIYQRQGNGEWRMTRDTFNSEPADAASAVPASTPAGNAAALAAAASSVKPPALVEELAWAYAITPGPAAPAPADDGTKFTLPGADKSFTLDQIRNRMGPADWFPGDHPSMPSVVAIGREQAGIWACSLCHYPNGKGRPENAGIAGLNRDYFIQQLHDFKNGARQSADARKPNTPVMAGFGVQMTEEEIRQSADYFSSLEWAPWIEVVESETVPKTRPSGGMWLRLEGADAGMEPLGRRIIESPKNTEYTEKLRNPRSGFTAYVPKGSIAKGEALATKPSARTTQCTICHGADLGGVAVVPTLRGRSPSYIARQLADLKLGTRHGLWSPLMAPVVANLTADDILNLSAYLSSLPVH